MTNILLLWETPDGNRHWEALEKKQVSGFLEQPVAAHIGTLHLTYIMPVDRDNGESPKFKVLDTWNCESRRVGKVWALYK